jgi:acyl-CoA synthetase (AMP-forming)/AMP-acid ligase II
MELVQRERITLWGQVPTMFLLQLALPDFDGYDLSAVEVIFFSGAPMPRPAVDELSQLGASLVTGYGLTETCGPVTLSEPGAGIAALSETIGRPLPEFEFKIADEEGRPVQPGQTGEICIRGDCVFQGYFNDPDATGAAIDGDGWFHTGDLAYLEEGDGNARLVGRLNERFKSGGYNIDPREIENVLEQHPGIALACVVPVADPLYHQVGYAFLLPKPGAALNEPEVRSFCHERLSNYKVPKRIIVREQLPMLAIGKIDRKALAEEATTQLARS